MTPPRVVARGRAAAGGFPGRRGRRALRVARERAATEGRGGVGAPRPTDGDMETLWGLRGHPFPGRRAVGAGHARPGGLRWHPSMVWPVGRGLDPSAGDCPGIGGDARSPLIRPCGATFPQGGRQGVVGEGFIPPGALAAAQTSSGHRCRRPLTPAAGPRCGAGGSGCSTSGLTKPALYRCNPGRCRGGSRR